MLTDEDWKDLPNDLESAFATLDDRLWEKVEEARTGSYNLPDDSYHINMRIVDQAEHMYVQMIKGFVDETSLNIDLLSDDDTEEYEWNKYFAKFRGKVVYYRARLGARNKAAFFAKPGEEVVLSNEFKHEIHTLINRIRKIVNASELDEQKKDSIYSRINELSDEVDRSTTKLGRFKVVWLDMTEAVGEGFENLEPAVKMLERIARIFGKARAETDPAQLPGPETPKQISGPDADAR